MRIAHCPRGQYLKVKGDLILISSDIDHSLSKILPLKQSLKPVYFKHKLSYSGSYLEEYVEKEKIKLHFDWFKRNNHIYKNIILVSKLIDDFFEESIQDTNNFEDITREDGDEMIYESYEEEENDVSEGVCDIYFKRDQTDSHEPLKSTENKMTHNQTTMFLNKYCEDTNITSVANKLADIIVDYETSQTIRIENEDDFEVDDEIITEDEFLRNIDQELDNEESNKDQENLNVDLIDLPSSEPD
jgi:hypothetical protein